MRIHVSVIGSPCRPMVRALDGLDGATGGGEGGSLQAGGEAGEANGPLAREVWALGSVAEGL